MKLLVHGGSLDEGSSRLRMAAAGLALRGHLVVWEGAGAARDLIASGDIEPAARRAGKRERVDLVLGGARNVLATAVSGWFFGAHAMLLEAGPGGLASSALERWAWGSLDSGAMATEEVEENALRAATTAGSLPVAGTWSREPVPERPDPAHPDTEALERAAERWLARRPGHAPRGAAFLDRDGTLVVEKGYLSDARDLELLPGAPGALARLHDAGFSLVVVSNQSGVGRGFFPLSSVYAAMARLRRELRKRGVELDAIYFCPHRPDQGCACRKPGPELLRQAARNLNLSLRRSGMIGDKRLDVATGHGAGALGVLVRTGYGRDEERREDPDPRCRPDFVGEDLAEAAEWLAGRSSFPE